VVPPESSTVAENDTTLPRLMEAFVGLSTTVAGTPAPVVLDFFPQPTTAKSTIAPTTVYKVMKPVERRMHPPPAQLRREADLSPASAA
jgi:hypothetical protein